MSEHGRPYTVLLTEEALAGYEGIRSNADLQRANGILDVLDTVPGIGRRYEPAYPAARAPFDLMVAYAGHYGIYYVVDEERRQVVVYYIEDQRQDPQKRFRNEN